ncbi:hypothetical protein PCANC_05617 [Puccinia coronata f. sp. avenae]|uniref:Uncharacterized protein n=1 Tax=Puccinia coronata f. sp. avenae TaxID=200324 RepID=A0A2N5VK33_9BASI|nr:hypothetical protein PCASD_01735 [Puccinia coronata f. sp. avenae]PLW54473.1 hypothetical protein PCANC_05617 [Puccinia coronata f. sp. avenae]
MHEPQKEVLLLNYSFFPHLKNARVLIASTGEQQRVAKCTYTGESKQRTTKQLKKSSAAITFGEVYQGFRPSWKPNFTTSPCHVRPDRCLTHTPSSTASKKNIHSDQTFQREKWIRIPIPEIWELLKSVKSTSRNFSRKFTSV